MTNEIYYGNAGPEFINGQLLVERGTPTLPVLGKKVKFQYKSVNDPVWPYAILTVPASGGMITESEKLELLYTPTAHPKVGQATRAEFAESHLYKAGITGVDVDVSSRLETADSFYCTGKGCWACKKKTEIKT